MKWSYWKLHTRLCCIGQASVEAYDDPMYPGECDDLIGKFFERRTRDLFRRSGWAVDEYLRHKRTRRMCRYNLASAALAGVE